MKKELEKAQIKIPCGHFCENCGGKGGCLYWVPQKKDNNGRQYCSYYGTYYYPTERNGCLSFTC